VGINSLAMYNTSMNILGIETTCDETSLAIVSNGRIIIQDITISQIEKHKQYGGVVPDLGAREHLTNLTQMGKDFLEKASGIKIDAVAVSSKIGLPPAVQVGEAYAAGLAKSLKVPLIPVNHVVAHMWGVWVDKAFELKPEFPLLALIVSGGHTQIMAFDNPEDYEVLGKTQDDAMGEAFDKVASMLGLPYPGGPAIEKAALTGDRLAIPFPVPLKNVNTMNFSFAGLKTSVRQYIEKERDIYPEGPARDYFTSDVAASFQQAACEHIAEKVLLAIKDTKYKTLVLGGGVACNQFLIDYLYNNVVAETSLDLLVPALPFCTDNAAMIAGYAYNLVEKQ